MRVAIYGSLRTVAPEQHKSFKQACVDLGIELAKRGHIPLLHSEGEKTADRYVYAGLLQFAQESKSRPRVEIHRSIDARRIYPDEDKVDIAAINYPGDSNKDDGMADKRLGPRVGTIADSDVVILIGGSKGTRKSGEYSRQLKKPILAIPYFGGSAQDIYRDTLEMVYLVDNRIASKIVELSQPAGKYPNALSLILLCQVLADQHTYFVSYSHGDSSIADHMEVMFLRANRHIRRDDRELEISDPIKTKLKEKIARSDTFFCLWSEKSANAEWCQWELATALKLKNDGGRLRRIVMIKVDGEDLTSPWSEFLQLDGSSRVARSVAVRRLIDDEIS